MDSRRLFLLITLGVLAIVTPRSGGEKASAAAEVAMTGDPRPSPLSAPPAPIATAAPQSRTADGETGLHAATVGPSGDRWVVAAFGPLDVVKRELLSVFVFVAGAFAAAVITGRIRRSDFDAGQHPPQAAPTSGPAQPSPVPIVAARKEPEKIGVGQATDGI